MGQGAFMLMGAYTFAVLTDRVEQLGQVDSHPWPFWAALVMAGLVACAAGVVLGALALRWRGVFLALGTFSAAIALPHILLRYDNFSGGARGLRFGATPPPPFLRGLLTQHEWIYFLGLVSFLVTFYLCWNLVRGPWGKGLVGTRDSEVAARAIGIDVTRVKVEAFALSAALGGIAGGLYVIPLRFVMHETIEPLESIYLFLALVVGGLGNLGAAIPAAALLTYLPTDLVRVVGQMPGLGVELVSRAPGLIQGALVILVLLLMPEGVMPTLQRLQAQYVAISLHRLPTAILPIRLLSAFIRKRMALANGPSLGRDVHEEVRDV